MKKANRNIITKRVKLERATAEMQYIEMITEMMNNPTQAVDYIIDSSCFTYEEARTLNMRMTRFMALMLGIAKVPASINNISVIV